MKFSIKNLFSKHDHIRRKLQIWLHLLRKSLIENFIFCAVKYDGDLSNSARYVVGTGFNCQFKLNLWVRFMKCSSKWSSQRTEYCVSSQLIWFTLLRLGFLMDKWKFSWIDDQCSHIQFYILGWQTYWPLCS